MKVFIIDDDDFSLFFTRYKLNAENLTADIHTFLWAEEALDALLECAPEDVPEVVLLDLNMPLMDGWQFLEALAPRWAVISKKCRIYILTSSLDSSDKSKADLNPMVSALFAKPIGSEEVSLLAAQYRESLSENPKDKL